MHPPTDRAPAGERGRQERLGLTARLWAAVVLAGCLAVLGLALWLRPDPRGYGTHEQLRTGPCGLMLVTGYPCPTCGMTTAFAHVVRGQFVRAFMAQPAGFVLAVATIVVAALGARVLVTGRWPSRLTRSVALHHLFLGLLIVLLGGWGLKLVLGLLMGDLPGR